MSRPESPYTAALLQWATDTNFSAGDESGLTTKYEPSSGQKAQGFVPGYTFPAAWANYHKHGVGLWLNYLSELATDSEFRTDFLASLFPSALAADTGFKAALAAEVWVWTVQNSWNLQTIHAAGVGLSGTSEALYTNIAGAATRRSTTVPIPLSSFQLHGGLESYTDTAGIIQNSGPDTDTNDYAIARIHPPAGSRVTQVRCLVEHTGGTVSPAGDVAEMSAGHVAPDKVAAYGASTYTSFGTAAAGTSSAFHLLTITVGGGGQEFGAQDELRVSIHAAFSVCATKIHWADYTFDDPGPRNF